MEKLTQYQELIRTIIADLAWKIEEQHPAAATGVEALPILDDQRGHYLLVNLGWSGQRRVRATTVHVRLRDGKFWIEDDMTEPCIADRLIEKGVPKSDIILAFQPPRLRPLTEFAAS